jgi:diaminopimelate decarboxylase
VRPPPAHVRAAAAARSAGAAPALIVDVAAIAARMRQVAAIARAHAIEVLFAVKSLPLPAVVAAALAELDGVDLAGPAEQALLATLAHAPARVSLADPRPRRLARRTDDAPVRRRRVGRRRRRGAGRGAARRTGAAGVDVGAGAGRRRDRRAGQRRRPPAQPVWPRAPDRDRTRRAARHPGGRARRRPRRRRSACTPTAPAWCAPRPAAWAELVAAMRALASAHDLAPSHLNLGGGWHGVFDAGDDGALLAEALAAARAAAGDLPLRIEPGRALSAGCVWAAGHVVAARPLVDRALRVVSLSRVCHLRWSPVRLVARAPAPGAGHKVHLVGPTCFEDDVVGEWMLDDELAVGAPVLLGDVSGYAVAWNTGFAGVPPAEVIVVGG